MLVGSGDKIAFAKGYGFCDEKAQGPDFDLIGINDYLIFPPQFLQ